MSRCKLTNMNLRNTRKSRDYQCIMIDLVNAGVVTKSAAEELLGYTIPEGLLDGDTPGPGPEPEPEAETPVITTDLEASAELTSEVTSLNLAVVAGVTDGGILSYAWTKNGDVIPDATEASLTVNEAGTYQCTITNTLGSDTATAQSTACVVTEEAASETVTLLYLKLAAEEGDTTEWLTAEYGLTDDPTGEGIVASAKTTFHDSSIDSKAVVELNPEYVEGESVITDKYITLDPQPASLEAGMLVKVYENA